MVETEILPEIYLPKQAGEREWETEMSVSKGSESKRHMIHLLIFNY